MKLDEMTDAELLGLSEEAAQQVVDLECAHQGVPFVPPEPLAPPTIAALRDVTSWTVGPYRFVNPEDANRVAALIAASPRHKIGYDWKAPSDMQYRSEGVDTTVPDVIHETHFSEAAYAKHSGRAAQLKLYDDANKARNDIISRRAAVHREVQSRIAAAHHREMTRISHETNLRHYLELAQGNGDIALSFFEKAYPGVLGEFDDLRAIATGPEDFAEAPP